MGTKGTQGNPYGHIKTIKIKIGEIHSKMEVSGRFEAVWPIVCHGIGDPGTPRDDSPDSNYRMGIYALIYTDACLLLFQRER